MEQFFNNRYVRIAALTIGLSVLFYGVIWLVCVSVGLQDFPAAVQLILAVCSAGILVYKFMAPRIG